MLIFSDKKKNLLEHGNIMCLLECKKTCIMLLDRNPEWGLPDMDVLRQLAFGNGMRLERIVSHIL